jgi:hypothetical protein
LTEGSRRENRPEDTFKRREIGLDEARYARVLDLDGDLAAVGEAGAMHLGDRGGGYRLGVELAKDLRDGATDLACHRPLDDRPRLRRHAVL